MKKQRFVTLFPQCSNCELPKDVAQIPFELNKYDEIDACLVSRKIKLSEEEQNDIVPNLKLHSFPLLFNDIRIAGAIYLLFYANRIDWLNVYHFDKKTLYWAKMYKTLNPKGKIYLKLDMDFRMCDVLDTDFKRRELFKQCTEIMDIVSVESNTVLERIKTYTEKEIHLISNGYCGAKRRKVNPQKKKNIFLTVGRLGTKQKATEILLEAFAATADKHNWELRLVGNIEKEFVQYIQEYYARFPQLENRVHFLGLIQNREILNEEYEQAKVFVLPSRWESFGLVLPEALSNGCKLIATDVVPPIRDLTCNNKYGIDIPSDNVEALSQGMVRMTQGTFETETILEIVDYAEKKFSWSKICELLYQEIEKNS